MDTLLVEQGRFVSCPTRGAAMKDNEQRDLFRKELERQARHLAACLQAKQQPLTIYRHMVVIGNLIDFLCFDCGITRFEDIQQEMLCSRFCSEYGSNVQGQTESEVKASVKKFFHFLVNKQGVSVGKDVLVGLNLTSR